MDIPIEKKAAFLIVCIVGLACVVGLLIYSGWHWHVDGLQPFRIASSSMTRALNFGDMVMVEPVSSVSLIRAVYETGDIICFHTPSNSQDFRIHRAVERIGGGLKTKGDSNNNADYWIITDDELVGKVVEVNSFPALVVLYTPWFLLSAALLVVLIIALSVSIVSKRKGDAVALSKPAE